MSALRNLGKAIGGFFFTTFLTLVIFMLAIAHFTACSTLKPIFVNILKQQMTTIPEQFNTTYTALLYQCNITRNETIYIQSLELKCSDISSITSSDLPEFLSNATFDKIYFKKYDCSFIQCIQLPRQEKFLFFISGQANEFFEKIIIYLGVATALSLFIFVAATETWPGRFKAVGVSLIFTGITYFLISFVKVYAAQQLPQEISTKVSPLINQIFDSISGNLLIIFIAGIILTTIGIVLGYLAKKKK